MDPAPLGPELAAVAAAVTARIGRDGTCRVDPSTGRLQR